MKELTIEEKAKAYDNALKKARQLCVYPTTKPFISDLQELFPELKESEDGENKRISKEITQFLKQNNGWNREWLDWLEKQKTMDKKIIFRPLVGTDIRIAAKQALEKIEIGKEVVLDFNGAYIPVNGKTVGEICNEYDAWLEKQGEKKDNNKLIWKHWSTGIAGNGDGEPIYLIKTGNIYSLSSCLSFECDYIELSELDNLMLEKQGEQKPTDKVEPKFKVKYAGSEYNVFETKDIAGVTFYGIEDEPNHIDYVKAENCDIINGYAIKENGSPYPTKPAVFSEQKSTDKQKFEIGDEIKTDNKDPLTITKINEQGYWSGDLFICSFEDSAKWELVGKRINKLEHKFHKGDWIIHQGTENIYQVVVCIDNQYQLKYGDNYTVQKCTDVDRCSRLWDITKDAKKGDVLQHNGCTFIFICIEKGVVKGFEEYLCNGTKACNFGKPNKDNNYSPATKEQRDTLIKAMADAGYTFDFEKKELKNIKQNLAEWSEEDIRNIENIDSVLFYDKDLPEETCMRLRNWLKSLKPNKDMVEALRTEYEKGRADTIAEMKKDYSEEDESNKLLALERKACITKTIEYFFMQLNEGDMQCGDIKKFVDNYKKYMEE